jgi:hypothetical protein
MTLLVDYNLDGYALAFLGILKKLGWLEFMCIQFVTFREVGLSIESSDRMVWRYAQDNQIRGDVKECVATVNSLIF